MQAATKSEVTIHLLGRSLSVVIGTDEEDQLKSAVSLIESKVQAYRKSYEIHEEAYLLLMCCLELATETLQSHNDTHQDAAVVSGKLEELNGLIEQALAAAAH